MDRNEINFSGLLGSLSKFTAMPASAALCSSAATSCARVRDVDRGPRLPRFFFFPPSAPASSPPPSKSTSSASAKLSATTIMLSFRRNCDSFLVFTDGAAMLPASGLRFAMLKSQKSPGQMPCNWEDPSNAATPYTSGTCSGGVAHNRGFG